jgi:RNA polymerase sigma factor (sigma-70 family)
MPHTSPGGDPALDLLPDDILLARAREQDPATSQPACWALLLRYQLEVAQRLGCLAAPFRLQEADAADLLHDALLHLSKVIPHYEATRSRRLSEDGLSAFLIRCAGNYARNWLRGFGRSRRRQQLYAGTIERDGFPTDGSPSGDAAEPGAEWVAVLRAVVGRLPEPDRQLASRFFERRTLRQVARDLGICERTAQRLWVQAKLRRAARLRPLLA